MLRKYKLYSGYISPRFISMQILTYIIRFSKNNGQRTPCAKKARSDWTDGDRPGNYKKKAWTNLESIKTNKLKKSKYISSNQSHSSSPLSSLLLYSKALQLETVMLWVLQELVVWVTFVMEGIESYSFCLPLILIFYLLRNGGNGGSAHSRKLVKRENDQA